MVPCMIKTHTAQEAMKTLVCLLQQQHPSLYIKNPFPWKPRRIPPNLHPKKTWKLKAEAKGFGGGGGLQASSNSQKNRIEKGTIIPGKDGGKNNTDDDDEEIPQVVFDKMTVRILISVGVPLAMGIGFLNLFGVIKEQHLWEVPVWVPALTTFLTFGSSALGIVYGTLSTSWDSDKKGSFLGVEEAQQNWAEMWREEEEEKKSKM